MKNNDKNPFNPLENKEESSGGTSSSGGQTGEIHFRYKDVMSIDPRDDMLPPEEVRHHLVVHKDIHKGLVDKQKQTRKERAALKEGKKIYSANGPQQGMGRGNGYKKHWISTKRQFSGAQDQQVNPVPSNNQANTNEKAKESLENRLENRLVNTPKFNPKPHFP